MRMVLWWMAVAVMTGMSWLMVMRSLPNNNFPVLLLIGKCFVNKLPPVAESVPVSPGQGQTTTESAEEESVVAQNNPVPESEPNVPLELPTEQVEAADNTEKTIPPAAESADLQAENRRDFFMYYFLPRLHRNQKQYRIPYRPSSDPAASPEVKYQVKENYRVEPHPGNIYLIQALAGNKIIGLAKISFPDRNNMQIDMLNEYALALSEVFDDFRVDKSQYRFSELLAVDLKISGSLHRIDLPPMLILELKYSPEVTDILSLLIEKKGELQLELPALATVNISDKSGKLLNNFEFDSQKMLKAYQRLKRNSALTADDLQREIQIGWVTIGGRKLFKVEIANSGQEL